MVEIFYIKREWLFWFRFVDFVFEDFLVSFFFGFFGGVCGLIFNWFCILGCGEVGRDLVFEVWLCVLGFGDIGGDLIFDIWLWVFGILF